MKKMNIMMVVALVSVSSLQAMDKVSYDIRKESRQDQARFNNVIKAIRALNEEKLVADLSALGEDTRKRILNSRNAFYSPLGLARQMQRLAMNPNNYPSGTHIDDSSPEILKIRKIIKALVDSGAKLTYEAR